MDVLPYSADNIITGFFTDSHTYDETRMRWIRYVSCGSVNAVAVQGAFRYNHPSDFSGE
jgi:hypothetical protein